MRKVTSNAIEAFTGNSGCSKSFGNTLVMAENYDWWRSASLFLHGNKIATLERIDGKETLKITNAGWFSNTTKERLNGLPNVSINQKKGVWYLNGKQWDGNWIEVK